LTLVDIIFLLGFVETIILFLYAARWYIFTFFSLRGGENRDKSKDCEKNFEDYFVSILLPIYNEPNVVDRLLKACTSFNSPEYEVIVIDDSDDGVTTEKIAAWKGNHGIKLIHRDSRKGWKGGALNTGLENVDSRSSHVLVFDADFVPPSDLMSRFVERFRDGEVVAVQGYQRHDLNADENGVTKGVRVWHSMYNMVELNGKQRLGLFLPLTGGVYMIRTDVLKELNFEEVTDEDWNLTVRLYEKGYKIDYDPSLAASGECPNTFRKLLRQHSRWAEGHTRTFRKYFWKILKSNNLVIKEKIDFLFTGHCFLHTVLVAILMCALVLFFVFPHITIPYPFAQIQTLLLVSTTPAAVLASLAALYLENAQKDFRKFVYAWLLNFLLIPSMAYAALKGLLTKDGYFNRTYKTGRIIMFEKNKNIQYPKALKKSNNN
jgi:cellulose synthase/poly-beta-1,6-N-acetylglucosamine synthase-like glycosyltransferase